MKPIFIFSACWRTGSTLLQRILNSSDDILIWGEPNFLYPAFETYQKAKQHFNDSALQHKEVKHKGFQNAWAPNLSPSVANLKNGMRSFFETTYLEPTEEYGKSRWGFKEVRQRAFLHAKMMKELFPEAIIVFHYRDPFDVYASLKETDFHSQFKGPYMPIRFWANNVKSFLTQKNLDELDAKVFRHEDIIGPDSEIYLADLAKHCEIELTDKMLNTIKSKVGSTAKKETNLTEQECSRIKQVIIEEIGEDWAERVLNNDF